MANIIKSGGALAGRRVIPRAFKLYKERVYDNGGVIVDEDYCADRLAFAAKYGISSGIAVSPAWGIRTHDGFVETLFGLFGTDYADPYVPLSSSPDVVLDTYENQNSLQLTTSKTIPASTAVAVSSSYGAMVAVRSQNANLNTEGYLIAIGQGADAGFRMTVSNLPTGGSSRLRVECGPSIRTTVFGSTKAALARWKVSGVYASAATLQAIEDGAVFATGVPGANFKATNYITRLGFDATNGGAFTANPADCRIAEAWAIPDPSAATMLALNVLLADMYES